MNRYIGISNDENVFKAIKSTYKQWGSERPLFAVAKVPWTSSICASEKVWFSRHVAERIVF